MVNSSSAKGTRGHLNPCFLVGGGAIVLLRGHLAVWRHFGYHNCGVRGVPLIYQWVGGQGRC